ncbi:MAG: hypothetical protein M0R03_05150 [Novosphingobium sp.]|nr:hypothetical protein [Novosphingobium sp.]
MKYGNLGTTGLKVSRLCFGCMSYGQGRMHAGWTLDDAAMTQLDEACRMRPPFAFG